jgi:uncharacterized membrane protein YgdD (TMEM256/DUF423 family)
MERVFFILGALSGGIGVALGAFGAHTLEARLTSNSLSTFQTGVRYQMFHALALWGVAFAITRWPDSDLAVAAGWFFVAGTILFSGSLYLLSVTDADWLGAVAPLGAFAFILGWLLLAFLAWRG